MVWVSGCIFALFLTEKLVLKVRYRSNLTLFYTCFSCAQGHEASWGKNPALVPRASCTSLVDEARGTRHEATPCI